jgi:hypothetical protein
MDALAAAWGLIDSIGSVEANAIPNRGIKIDKP